MEKNVKTYDDICVSTRVRFARNDRNFPFPKHQSEVQGKQMVSEFRNVIKDSEVSSNFNFLSLSSLSPIEKRSLTERHLISPEFESSTPSKGLLLSKDEKISIMIGEEDQLRIQCIIPGFSPGEAFGKAKEIDEIFDRKLEYAFDEELGFLTHCPTNLGTGLRASFMLHLPAITRAGHMGGLIYQLSKVGIAVRGIYGEGSEAEGYLYQVSNQTTLGIDEEETMERLMEFAKQIMEAERLQRMAELESDPDVYKDHILRAFGILSWAKLLSAAECLSLLSDIREGAGMGILPDIPFEVLGRLIGEIYPGALMVRYGEMNARERDLKRAQFVKEQLAIGS